jgi:hypothetical protein
LQEVQRNADRAARTAVLEMQERRTAVATQLKGGNTNMATNPVEAQDEQISKQRQKLLEAGWGPDFVNGYWEGYFNARFEHGGIEAIEEIPQYELEAHFATQRFFDEQCPEAKYNVEQLRIDFKHAGGAKAMKKKVRPTLKSYTHRMRVSFPVPEPVPARFWVCEHLSPEENEEKLRGLARISFDDPDSLGVNVQLRFCKGCDNKFADSWGQTRRL